MNAHTPIAGDDPFDDLRKVLDRAHAVIDGAAIHREQRERDEPHQFDEPPFDDYPEMPPFNEPQAIDRDAVRAARTPQEAARIKAGQSQQTRVPKKITRARLLSCLRDLDAELRFDAFANEPQIRRGDGTWKPLCDNQLRRLWTDSEAVLSFLAAQSVFNELAIDEAQRNAFDCQSAFKRDPL
jgi:hypothetical protein